jgi:hypothetical protein
MVGLIYCLMMRNLIIAGLDTDMGAHGKRGALQRCGAGGLLPATKVPGIHKVIT